MVVVLAAVGGGSNLEESSAAAAEQSGDRNGEPSPVDRVVPLSSAKPVQLPAGDRDRDPYDSGKGDSGKGDHENGGGCGDSAMLEEMFKMMGSDDFRGEDGDEMGMGMGGDDSAAELLDLLMWMGMLAELDGDGDDACWTGMGMDDAINVGGMSRFSGSHSYSPPGYDATHVMGTPAAGGEDATPTGSHTEDTTSHMSYMQCGPASAGVVIQLWNQVTEEYYWVECVDDETIKSWDVSDGSNSSGGSGIADCEPAVSGSAKTDYPPNNDDMTPDPLPANVSDDDNTGRRYGPAAGNANSSGASMGSHDPNSRTAENKNLPESDADIVFYGNGNSYMDHTGSGDTGLVSVVFYGDNNVFVRGPAEAQPPTPMMR